MQQNVITNDQAATTNTNHEGGASGNTDHQPQVQGINTAEAADTLGVPESEVVSAGRIVFPEAENDTAPVEILRVLPKTEEVDEQEGTANVAATAVAEKNSATTSTKAAKPAARKPYDKSVEQPFHEHMVPGSRFFFSTAKEITPAEYEKELRKKFEQVPIWLEANSYWEFFGRLVMIFMMAKISMRRGLKHSLLFRDVLKEKVLEWAKKELKQTDDAKKFYTGDEDFDQFRQDAWNFNWEFEKIDSRMGYKLAQELFDQLVERAEKGGDRYEKALVYIAGEHNYDIKQA